MLLLACVIVILLPDFRSNNIYNKELECLVEKYRDNLTGTDVVFIGSSKVKNHFNNELFDSITGIQSMNLGVAATNPPETYFLLQKLLDDGLLDKKTAIIEVRSIHEISYKNWWLPRSYYWIDSEGYDVAKALVRNNQMSNYRKILAKASYFIGYVANSMSLNVLRDDLFGLPTKEICIGFEGLENRTINCNLLHKLNRNTANIVDSNIETINSDYIEYLEKLIEKFEAKNSHLIYYLSEANLNWQIKDIQPLFNNLPNRNKIEIADVRMYPFLDNCGIKYNVTHFDKVGADTLTATLANEYLKISKTIQ